MSLFADHSSHAVLVAVAADPQGYNKRLETLKAKIAEFETLKREALRLRKEADEATKFAAGKLAETAEAAGAHAKMVADHEASVAARVQALDDKERGLVRKEEALVADQRKHADNVTTHGRYREKEAQALQLRQAAAAEIEGKLAKREKSAAELERQVMAYMGKLSGLPKLLIDMVESLPPFPVTGSNAAPKGSQTVEFKGDKQ